MEVKKKPKRIRPKRPQVKIKEMNQSIRFLVRRDLWAEFQENCLRQHQKPLATMRDWIGQFNDHCEESRRENTID